MPWGALAALQSGFAPSGVLPAPPVLPCLSFPTLQSCVAQFCSTRGGLWAGDPALHELWGSLEEKMGKKTSPGRARGSWGCCTLQLHLRGVQLWLC